MGLDLFFHSTDGYLKWLYFSLIHSCWEHIGRCAQLCFSRWTLRSGLLGHGVFSILIHTAKLPFRSTIPIFTLISSVSSHFLRPQALYCLPIWWMKKMGTHICSFLIFILQTLVKLNVFSYDVYQPMFGLIRTVPKLFLIFLIR